MSEDFTATYSPEDNKLRIYALHRFDDEMLQRVKGMGFKWAPKQELFVAPRWTPDREDFCIELAGEITAEQTTFIERAEAKAERLDAIAANRSRQSSQFHAAANRISERFAGGQPILVGHHSERRARKDQKRMHDAMDKAVAAQKAVQYWGWRAEGVERHANMKGSTRTRLNRIKTLLAELRDLQRDINHAHLCFELWESIQKKKDHDDFPQTVKHWAGVRFQGGGTGFYLNRESLYDRLCNGSISPLEAVESALSFWAFQRENPGTLRWINHTLKRLDYERFELGPVSRFTGDLTPVILQIFCRTHGADKPKASKTEKGFKVVSDLPLPLHIAEGKEIDLTPEEWRDLMESVGYDVPEKRPAKVSILNFRCQAIQGQSFGGVCNYPQIEMTKAEYSKVYSDYRGVRVSKCGTFRFKTIMKNHSLYSVYLTDSKTHEAPDSSAVTYEEEVA